MKSSRLLLSILLLIIFSNHSSAQYKEFSIGDRQNCTKLLKVSQNSYVIGGNSLTYFHGPTINCIDSTGNLLWVTMLVGDSIRIGNFATHLIQTNDNGFLIAGYSSELSTDSDDVQIFKTDSMGHLQWGIRLTGNVQDRALAAIQLSDSSYILTGQTNSLGSGKRTLLFKIDKYGNLIWSRAYRLTGDGTAIKRCNSGGYVVGVSNSFPCVLRFNNSDQLIWASFLDNILFQMRSILDIIQTNDGGFVIAGYVLPSLNYSDNLIAKLDSSGNYMWHVTTDVGRFDYLSEIIETKDHGLVAFGGTEYTGFATDKSHAVICRFDGNGNFLWERKFTDSCRLRSGIINADDGYSVIGEAIINSNSKIYFSRMDSLGFNCSGFSDTGITTNHQVTFHQETLLFDDASSALTYTQNGLEKNITSTVEQICDNSTSAIDPQQSENKLGAVYPNPFTDHLIIKLDNTIQLKIEILNSIGQKIFTRKYPDGIDIEITIPTSKLNPGIYFVTLSAKDYYRTIKAIKN